MAISNMLIQQLLEYRASAERNVFGRGAVIFNQPLTVSHSEYALGSPFWLFNSGGGI